MSKQMLTEAEWSLNVGSQAFPVSFLHEYAVGLLWDRLHGRGPVTVTMIDGNQSGDLMQGVDRVVIPDAMQPIGGCIPDLALLDANLRPVRVIEVIVTSPPTDEKMEKLERLKERGVEVVLVPVRGEVEVKALVGEQSNVESPNWGPYAPRTQRRADGTVHELIHALTQCSPDTRRQLVRILNELESLDSLYPLSAINPKKTAVVRQANTD